MKIDHQQQQQHNHHRQLSFYIIIIHIALRISLSNKAPITDCDEVYNYWEPLHYLHYGSGMQTWEYAPQYALRTYAYLLPMYGLSKIYECIIGQCPLGVIELVSSLVSPFDSAGSGDNSSTIYGSTSTSTSATITTITENKVLVFHLLRATISILTAIGELRLIQTLFTNYSKSVALYTWFLLLTSTGMFHTAPAYLPSSTVMICIFHSLTEQVYSLLKSSNSDDDNDNNDKEKNQQQQLKRLDHAIFYGLIAVLMTGWPFCAILFIPLGIFATIQNYRLTTVTTTTMMTNNNNDAGGSNGASGNGIIYVIHLYKRVVLYAIAIQTIVMAIDYRYYGKLISPTMNIFVYNTGLFSGGDGDGDGINRDELYGVEDVSYYIKNLILNWNIAAIAGIVVLPLLFVIQLLIPTKNTIGTTNTKRTKELILMSLMLAPVILWVGTVFSRPHKEERFLFPIYPMIAVGTALVIDKVLDVFLSIVGINMKKDGGTKKIISGFVLLVPFALFSVSRNIALSDGYTAPLKLYSHLYDHHITSNKRNGSQEPMLVCAGGEWYRFPSSYHLPNNVQLAFLKSSFGGQLPQQFTEFGSTYESLSIQNGRFNDLNEEEMDRYVSISDCEYVIELVDESKSLEGDVSSECLQYMKEDESDWVEVTKFDFLDADSTPLLHRVLFLPFKRKASYKSYMLFERTKI